MDEITNSRETLQEFGPGDDLANICSNDDSKTDQQQQLPIRTIVLNNVNNNKAEPRRVMQAVVDAVQNQFKRHDFNTDEKSINSTELPDLIVSDPEKDTNDQQNTIQQSDIT